MRCYGLGSKPHIESKRAHGLIYSTSSDLWNVLFKVFHVVLIFDPKIIRISFTFNRFMTSYLVHSFHIEKTEICILCMSHFECIADTDTTKNAPHETISALIAIDFLLLFVQVKGKIWNAKINFMPLVWKIRQYI